MTAIGRVRADSRCRAGFYPVFFQVVRLETVFETVRRDPHCNGSRFTSASARFRLSMCSKNVGLAHFDELRPRFPKKAEAKPQVVFGGLLGIWHPGGSGVPNRRFCCTQPLRNRASARLDREPAHRLGRASVRPGLASESGRGRPSNQPSNSTACGNYLHVSLFFGNFAIMTDRVHVLRVFHTCAPVAEYTRKRG